MLLPVLLPVLFLAQGCRDLPKTRNRPITQTAVHLHIVANLSDIFFKDLLAFYKL